jgi:uncharacterized protein YcbX
MSVPRQIGRVVGLWRYPVMAMAGEALQEGLASWHGLAGDRRWAFVREGQLRSGFPWLTLRERPELGRYQPSLLDPAHPDTSPTWVRTPSGGWLEVIDPALAAELGAAWVIRQDRGAFDALPLSLITTRALASLGALLGEEVDVRRFRPNLVLETSDGRPFPEDDWVGSTLQIGALRLRVDQRISRCAVVQIDPRSHRPDGRVLRTLARERQARLGVCGQVMEPGKVAVGDAVWLAQG